MSYQILFLSVLLGALIVYVWNPNKLATRLLLAFSGAYLLSVTILHLLPEVFLESKNTNITGILIISGILIQFILESFSKGAEHGHIHVHSKTNKLPLLLFISLCIHAFSEGLPIHNSNDNILLAVVVHKIPIAVVLTAFLRANKTSVTKTIIYLFIFAIMSPLGLFLSEKIALLTQYENDINAVIIGVFLHISTVILFESTENHKFNIQKFTVIIIGVLLTIATL